MPWTIDLEASTASHQDGWVFKFSPVPDEPGALDGECVGQPEKLTSDAIVSAARLAREAGEAFMAARREAALQELADESQRLGLYDTPPTKH